MTPSGLGLDHVENLLLDAGDGDLMEGGGGNRLDGGDGDLLVGGLRGGGGGSDGDLVVGVLRGGCSDGDLPVVDDDGARAVFSIAPRSGEDAMERTARLGASAPLLP